MKRNLKIDKKFHALIPPLTEEEYKALEQSIVKEGCRDSLVVWRGIVLDGHHRYEICQKHGVAFNVKEIKLRSHGEARLWILRNQLARRNLTTYQRVVLALKFEPYIKKEAERKKREAGKRYGRGQSKKVHQKKEKPINTLREIAKIAGVSSDTIYKVKYILKHPIPKIIDRLNKARISVGRAANLTQLEIYTRDKEVQERWEKERLEAEKKERDRLLKKEGRMQVIERRGGYGNWRYQEIRRLNDNGEIETEWKVTDKDYLELEKHENWRENCNFIYAILELNMARSSFNVAMKRLDIKSIVNSINVSWLYGVVLYYPILLTQFEELHKVFKKLCKLADSVDESEKIKVKDRYFCKNKRRIVNQFLTTGFYDKLGMLDREASVDLYIKAKEEMKLPDSHKPSK